MTGGKFFDSKGQGRAELNWRMNRLYNSAKHASDFIKRASFKGDMLIVWISNDGLETRNEKMAFGELAESWTTCVSPRVSWPRVTFGVKYLFQTLG